MGNTLKRGLSLLLACLLLTLGGLTALADAAPAAKEDFYEAINAEWLATAEIPADMPVAGGFTDLMDDIEATLMADFAAMLAGEQQPDSEQLASFLEYYRLAANLDARDAAGAAPLQPTLEQVEALDSLAAYAAQWAEWDLSGMPAPFTAFVMADMGHADTNALYVEPAGLFLLDKSYYEDEATRDMLQSLFAMMAYNLLVLAGKTEADAERIVTEALAFDASIAPYMLNAEESSNYTSMYNPTPFDAFDAGIEGFDLTALFSPLLGAVPETVIVTVPRFFDALDALVNEETFPAMKSWLLVQVVASYAPYLSEDFRVEAGSFMRALSGTAEPMRADKSAYQLAASLFNEVVGIYYGRTYFGEAAKQDVREMVQRLIATYEQRIAANTWLSADTREMAIKKLNGIALNIGYPDAPRAVYDQMQTVPEAEGGTFLGNTMAFTRAVKADNYRKWNTPVDRTLWPLSADTVNAMYSAMDNSINFPAAILQAPFYSLEQSASANFGGIGAVIAHEISHAFDPNGAKFDELGNLADWWTEQDYAAFTERSQAMVALFDGYAYAGGAVNGALTVAENVADLGGVACALEAVKLEADADLTAFFTNHAVIWRQKASPEYEALLLMLDVHAPAKLRVNLQLPNFEDFLTTFGIAEGDAMYRAPEARINIW